MTLGLGRTRSVTLTGLDGALVDVEAHIAQGLPRLRHRRACPTRRAAGARPGAVGGRDVAGVPVPPHRVTVNLSPASIPKHGSGFDLPIAVAVLPRRWACVERRARRGRRAPRRARRSTARLRGGAAASCPAVLAAARAGVRHVVVPLENVAEAQLVDGVTVHGAAEPARRRRLVRAPSSAGAPAAGAAPAAGPTTDGRPRAGPDLADVVGQPEARLALELAAAGGHHLLMSGPPGVGKTMLAERLVTGAAAARARARPSRPTPSARSPATSARSAELDRTPPFVAPHHSASVAAVAGGGSGVALPGAISRAHRGVLFLDEAPEFSRPGAPGAAAAAGVGRGRRSPGRRQVVRYPARFLLVLAANPCPCGAAWGKGLDCTCTPMEIRAYRPAVRAAARPGRPPGARAAGAAGRLRRRDRGSPARRWPRGSRRPGRPAARGGPAAAGRPTGSCPGTCCAGRRGGCRRPRPPCSTGPSTRAADAARLRPGAAGRLVGGRPGRRDVPDGRTTSRRAWRCAAGSGGGMTRPSRPAGRLEARRAVGPGGLGLRRRAARTPRDPAARGCGAVEALARLRAGARAAAVRARRPRGVVGRASPTSTSTACDARTSASGVRVLVRATTSGPRGLDRLERPAVVPLRARRRRPRVRSSSGAWRSSGRARRPSTACASPADLGRGPGRARLHGRQRRGVRHRRRGAPGRARGDGPTVAVLACGVDRAYPRRTAGCSTRVAAAGRGRQRGARRGALPTGGASSPATGSSPRWRGPPSSSRPACGRARSPRPRRPATSTCRSARCPGR